MPQPDTPFRIVILGDFSGRANRGLAGLGGRRPVLVDRDNLGQVIAKFGVELDLPVAGAIRFTKLDDFHPDRIYERVEMFQGLRQTRDRLGDSSAFAAAAAEVRAWTKTEKPAPASDLARLKPDKLLQHILDEIEGPGEVAQPTRPPDEWKEFVRGIVAPYLVPAADPRQPELMAQVDAATSDQMRQVLHHPEFQALEAAWRAVSFLARGLETGVQLKLYLLDISKAELASDVVSTEDLRSSGIYRLLVEQTVGTPGGEPWAAVAANFTFGQTPEDIELLARMGMIARAARAPFLAGASPHLLGCESLAATPDPDDWQPEADPEGHQFWEALRAMPEAQYLGLALPRFLLRLPYGKDTEPTEKFDFEEMPEGSRHESYLWGNPAFVCAYLLGQAFSEFGWYLRPGVFQQIDGLPAHVYEEDGESHLKPCAEALLTNRAAEIILDEGLMPLLSIAGRADVRLARFQSIAKPARPLAGQWG